MKEYAEMRSQKGSVSVFVMVMLVCVGLFWVWLHTPAAYTDIESVIKVAQGNKQARESVSQFLRENPKPTKWQLGEEESKVNAILVQDLAVKQGGAVASAPKVSSPIVDRSAVDESNNLWSFFTVGSMALTCFAFLLTGIAKFIRSRR